MIAQERNNQQVEILKADFQHLSDPSFAWGNVMSMYQALPALRGFWPMSAVDSVGDVVDLSGNGLTLTNTSALFDVDALAPLVDMSAASSDLNHADSADFDIAGTEAYVTPNGLTLGGWFRRSSSPGSNVGLMTKWNTTGNQRAYQLIATTSGVTFQVSFTGITGTGSSQTPVLAADTWYFLAGRYLVNGSAGETYGAWINDTYNLTGSASSAAIFNSTASFYLGSINGASYWAGDTSLCFLCASALSVEMLAMLYHRSRRLFGV